MRLAARFAPPLVLMGLIFFLSAQPDLSSGLGNWDTVGRKLVHMGIFGALVVPVVAGARLRAPRAGDRDHAALRRERRVPPDVHPRPPRLAVGRRDRRAPASGSRSCSLGGEEGAQHADHEPVVLLLRKPGHRDRPDDADVAHDQRERPAVGGELALVEQERSPRTRRPRSRPCSTRSARSAAPRGSCARSTRRCRPPSRAARSGRAAARRGRCRSSRPGRPRGRPRRARCRAPRRCRS